jgi:hypothetical protein
MRPVVKTYSVFVRFRDHRRLTLSRRVPTLEAAIACAERYRSARFHDRDAVFIVDDMTGERVDEQQASAQAPPASGEVPSAPGVHIRDARRRLERALEDLPQFDGSAAVKNTTEAIALLTAAEDEIERLERLADERDRRRKP